MIGLVIHPVAGAIFTNESEVKIDGQTSFVNNTTIGYIIFNTSGGHVIYVELIQGLLIRLLEKFFAVG